MSEKKLEIRPAVAMDSVNIVRLLKQAHGESPVKMVAEFDDQRVLEYVTTTLRHCFCIVADLSGRLLGSVAVAPIRLPWSPKTTVMAESWLVVMPQYRAKGIPQKLLEQVNSFLDTQNLVAFLGTSVIAPSDFDGILEQVPQYHVVRRTFIRIPLSSREKVTA